MTVRSSDTTNLTRGASEFVVLVNERGEPLGEQLKSTVHSSATPLHLAFSLYLFDEAGRLLMTRRALGKSTWPGVWTNSCCGHPLPGESTSDAISRRLAAELGMELSGLRCVLPGFSYRARDASGIWENEICPVFVGDVATATPVLANPDEVMEFSWIDGDAVVGAIAAAPFAFSPWVVEQTAQMVGPDGRLDVLGSRAVGGRR